MSEYKSTLTEIKFVPLAPKKTIGLTAVDEPKSIETTILMEIGSCKIHVPEKMAMTLLAQALEVNPTNV